MVNSIERNGVPMQGSVQVDRSGPDKDITNDEFQKMVDSTVKKVFDEVQLPTEQAKELTKSMNKFLEGSNSELRFEFHEKLNEYYVTIIDSKTHEVIKEVPSKKLMDVHAAMREFNGLFVNQKI